MNAYRVAQSAKSRIKNNVPSLNVALVFRYTRSVKTMSTRRQEQKQRYLKAKVAMTLYTKYGRVPNEREIDEVYYLTRMLKAVLGTHFYVRNKGILIN